MEERFTYDLLDRLTGVVEGLDTTGVFAYDAYGRMTSKCNISISAYGFCVGEKLSYSGHYNESGMKTDGFTLGIGRTIGIDVMPFNINASVNYGASNAGGLINWTNNLRKAFDLNR